MIQATIRHKDIGTTLGFYVQTSGSLSREALEKVEEERRKVFDKMLDSSSK
jgi:hypothetical protein